MLEPKYCIYSTRCLTTLRAIPRAEIPFWFFLSSMTTKRDTVGRFRKTCWSLLCARLSQLDARTSALLHRLFFWWHLILFQPPPVLLNVFRLVQCKSASRETTMIGRTDAIIRHRSRRSADQRDSNRPISVRVPY